MNNFFYKNYLKKKNNILQNPWVQEDEIQSLFHLMTTSNSHHVLPLNFQLPLLPPDFGPPNAYPMSTASGPSGAKGSSEVAGRKQYYWNR